MRNLTKCIALTSLLITGATSASAATVVNGSFEIGANGLTGWSTGGSGSTPGIGITVITTGGINSTGYGDNVPNYDGTHAAYFVDDNAEEFLRQTIAFTVGAYTLDFGLFATSSGAANPFSFTLTDFIGGNLVATNNNTTVPVGVWTPYSYAFNIATAGNYVLNFNYVSGPTPAKDVLLDKVAINAVPEPATWAMMIGGLALVGATMRRRRVAVSFV